MQGLIGKKIGMTSVFNEQGNNIPCTVIEAGPCVVTQIKTTDKDGYEAVQLGFEEKKEKKTTKALAGHFKKANSSPKKKVVEFIADNEKHEVGEIITVETFNNDTWLDVTGTSKGKGFQGVVKRHGFHGVGGSTHGQHNRERAPGSIGAASYPSRVFKGMRMGGRDGNKRVKMINCRVMKIIPENNILVIKGSVPGAKGSYLIITK